MNLVVDHLTEHGAMSPAMLYESPFTDVAPSGPETLFTSAEVDQLIAVVTEVSRRAAAA